VIAAVTNISDFMTAAVSKLLQMMIIAATAHK
jgi:hypothetical protein